MSAHSASIAMPALPGATMSRSRLGFCARPRPAHVPARRRRGSGCSWARPLPCRGRLAKRRAGGKRREGLLPRDLALPEDIWADRSGEGRLLELCVRALGQAHDRPSRRRRPPRQRAGIHRVRAFGRGEAGDRGRVRACPRAGRDRAGVAARLGASLLRPQGRPRGAGGDLLEGAGRRGCRCGPRRGSRSSPRGG